MITLKDFMETVQYRITEGSDYGWQCFGPNAYMLSYWNGDYDGHSLNIVFDTATQAVYTAEVCDYRNSRAYRLVDPEFKSAHDSEAQQREVDHDQAWDDIKYTDLDVDEDWLEKARAIVAGQDYDTRVVLPVDLPDDVLFALMRQAHERDITLNQHMERILKEEIDRVLCEQELRDEYDFSEAESGPAPEAAKKLKKKNGKLKKA
jgi:hypothetical protein